MVEIGVCIEMVFTDLPYDRRIEEVKKAGFDVVEFWFHDATFDGSICSKDGAKDPQVMREVCESNGMKISDLLVNAPDGSFGGTPVDSRDLNKYLDRVHEAISFSKEIGTSKGITLSGSVVPGLSRTQMRTNLETAWGEAARIAEKEGYTLLAEPLNTYVDHVGYYLDSTAEGAEIVRGINSPNLKLLYDIYHMQIMEGNIIANIEKYIDIIDHFHAACTPGRNEIMNGELNYLEVIRRINATGYNGSFGLEYAPSMKDSGESLKVTRAFLDSI